MATKQEVKRFLKNHRDLKFSAAKFEYTLFLYKDAEDKLFDLSHISIHAAALCTVFAIAEITIMRWLTISFDKLSDLHKKKMQKKASA